MNGGLVLFVALLGLGLGFMLTFLAYFGMPG